MLDKFIGRRLEKQGLMVIPKNWADDYKELVEKNKELHRIIREIAREYDNLLQELAEHKTISELKRELEEIGIEGNNNSKKELVEAYINTFKINFDDDTDEEVK